MWTETHYFWASVGAIFVWFIGTFAASLTSSDFGQKRDFFHQQFSFVAGLITGPPKWAANLVTLPVDMVREYWKHQERIRELATANIQVENRLQALEGALSNGDS